MSKEDLMIEPDPWEIPSNVKPESIIFGIFESLETAKGTGCPNCLAVVQRLAVRGNIKEAVSLAQLSIEHHVCPMDKDICNDESK